MIVLKRNLLTLAVATALLSVPMATLQADELPPAPPGPYSADGVKAPEASENMAASSVEMKVGDAETVAPVTETEEAPEQAEAKTEEAGATESAETEQAEAPAAEAEEVTAEQTDAAAETDVTEQAAAPAVQPQPPVNMPVTGMPQMPQVGMNGQQRMMPGYHGQPMYGYPQYYRPQVQYIYVVPMMMPRMSPEQRQQMQQQMMRMYGGYPQMQQMMMQHQNGAKHHQDGEDEHDPEDYEGDDNADGESTGQDTNNES